METERVNAQAGTLIDAPGLYQKTETAPEQTNELGKDAFLKLLVAQLRYQDPLDPSSSEEFISTTAQFTVVEKLDELTKQGENTALVNSLTTASSLVGREITALRDGVPVTAVVEQSRLVSGAVQLETSAGSISLDQITSVGAVPQPAPVIAPVSNPSPAVPANTDGDSDAVAATDEATASATADGETETADVSDGDDTATENVDGENLDAAAIDDGVDGSAIDGEGIDGEGIDGEGIDGEGADPAETDTAVAPGPEATDVAGSDTASPNGESTETQDGSALPIDSAEESPAPAVEDTVPDVVTPAPLVGDQVDAEVDPQATAETAEVPVTPVDAEAEEIIDPIEAVQPIEPVEPAAQPIDELDAAEAPVAAELAGPPATVAGVETAIETDGTETDAEPTPAVDSPAVLPQAETVAPVAEVAAEPIAQAVAPEAGVEAAASTAIDDDASTDVLSSPDESVPEQPEPIAETVGETDPVAQTDPTVAAEAGEAIAEPTDQTIPEVTDPFDPFEQIS